MKTAKAALGRLCAAGPPDTADLLTLLEDRRTHAAAAEPEIGLDAALARALSAIFIETPRYGTRCSSVLRVRADGEVEFVERRHAPQRGDAHFRFPLHRTRFSPA